MDTFQIHSQDTGKISIAPTIKVDSRETLSLVYTPEVGKICMAIKDNPEEVRKYTIAGKMVAVISNGTAVLGFGDIGPAAALPVMEGKAVIFKEFANVNAFPICISEKDPDKLVEIVKAISVNFAAINLEDISAPTCFHIEKRLQDELDIPVMHDDQHGTAIVTLAALKGALKLVNKKNVRIVVAGAGAAGSAITKLLAYANERENLFSEVALVDSVGVVSSDRKDLNEYKVELAQITKQEKSMSLTEVLKGADVFIGVSVKDLLKPEMVKSMNKDAIVFAMANPTPEIMPDIALENGALIVATGRSDYPNQINNALAYPGVFKGLLENKVKKVTIEMKYKAANTIYEYNLPSLTKTNLLPSILDKKVPDMISKEIH
jgi:malate dehydrogenase (oxaloacetate-decarboxylating)